MAHFTWKQICLEYMTSTFVLISILQNNTVYELYSKWNSWTLKLTKKRKEKNIKVTKLHVLQKVAHFSVSHSIWFQAGFSLVFSYL